MELLGSLELTLIWAIFGPTCCQNHFQFWYFEPLAKSRDLSHQLESHLWLLSNNGYKWDEYHKHDQQKFAYLVLLVGTIWFEFMSCEMSHMTQLTWHGILLPNLFRPTVRKNWSSDPKRLFKLKAEDWEFEIFLRSLGQFIQTVKGQNNLW